MKYKVLAKFADLQDGKRIYCVGDQYPRSGYTPSPERIAELEGKKNKIGISLIEKVADSNDADIDGGLPDSEKLVRPRSKKVVRKSNNK